MRVLSMAARPKMSPSSTMTSPVASPMRSSIRSLAARLRRAIARWMPTAQLSASLGDGKAANVPSPVDFTTSPLKAATSAATSPSRSRRSSSLRWSPRRSCWGVDETASVVSNVTTRSPASNGRMSPR